MACSTVILKTTKLSTTPWIYSWGLPIVSLIVEATSKCECGPNCRESEAVSDAKPSLYRALPNRSNSLSRPPKARAKKIRRFWHHFGQKELKLSGNLGSSVFFLRFSIFLKFKTQRVRLWTERTTVPTEPLRRGDERQHKTTPNTYDATRWSKISSTRHTLSTRIIQRSNPACTWDKSTNTHMHKQSMCPIREPQWVK